MTSSQYSGRIGVAPLAALSVLISGCAVVEVDRLAPQQLSADNPPPAVEPIVEGTPPPAPSLLTGDDDFADDLFLAPQPGSTTLVDGKVGDVNGEPVFAEAFFRGFNLAGPLRLAAAEILESGASEIQARGLFGARARQLIDFQLNRFVNDEVIYRERLAADPGDGQGLRVFLNFFRENLRRQSYGSIESADRRRRALGDESIDEYLERLNREQAIAFEVQQSVVRGVTVTWREVQNEYRRDPAFHPDPVAYVRLIRVPLAESAAVRDRLESGERFEAVASGAPNTHRPDSGGLLNGEPSEFTGAFREYSFVGIAPINDALTELGEGEWAGPIESGATAFFVALDRIEERSVPLYDVQTLIEDRILSRKRDEAITRYITTLRSEASFTDVEIMVERLLEYAERSYFDPLLALTQDDRP